MRLYRRLLARCWRSCGFHSVLFLLWGAAGVYLRCFVGSFVVSLFVLCRLISGVGLVFRASVLLLGRLPGVVFFFCDLLPLLNGFGLCRSFLWWGVVGRLSAVVSRWRAFLWMAFLVVGVVGVSLWRLGVPCVSCSFGGLVVLLAVVFGFRAASYCVWGVLLMS